MVRLLTGVVIASVFLFGLVISGDVKAGREKERSHRWVSADTSWGVGGFGELRPGLLEEILSRKPAELDGLKVYELQFSEPGEWCGFCIGLWHVKSVVFSKNTKFVVTAKDGRRVESVAIVFTPDRIQSEAWDSRRMPVVVSEKSVWSACEDGVPGGYVKFPLGSIKRKEVVSFEVVGAVEQRDDGEVK